MQTKQMFLSAKHPNRPGTKLAKVTGVVVHWTANEGKGSDAVANRNYFNRQYRVIAGQQYETYNDAKGNPVKFRKASAHINVDDTEMVEVLPWKKGQAEMGYHVGATKYIAGITKKLGNTYPNAATIGLEICVNSDGDFKKAYANGVQVIAMMLKEHGLGIDSLFRHFDVTGKLCPGFFTDNGYAKKYLNTTKDAAWAQFQADVKKAMTSTATPPRVGAAPTAPAKAITHKPAYRVFQKNVQVASFATMQPALDWADKKFKETKDATVVVKDPGMTVIYTPSKKVKEDTAPQAKPAFRVFQKDMQKASFATVEPAVKWAGNLYKETKDPSIVVKNPIHHVVYTPSKHL